MLVRFGISAVAAAAVGYTSTHSFNVSAADVPSPAKEQHKKKIRPSELPLYGEPEPAAVEFVPEKENAFRQQISHARQWTWGYLDSIKDNTDMVKDKYQVAKAHSTDALKYIQDDSSVLPRLAVITVAGLGGVVAGYRGGRIKKTFYASIGMAAAASVCYPREAISISSTGWQRASDFIRQLYQENFSSASSKPRRIVETDESVATGSDKNKSTENKSKSH